MTDADPDRSLPRDEIAAMLRCVNPDWELAEATLADRGWTSLYLVTVDTGEGRRRCVLKASPQDDHPRGIHSEARIHAVVAERTDIPVPEIIGVVDEHDDLRAPFFLMEHCAGEPIPMAEVGALPDDSLRSVARQTGRYLGQLHALDVEFDQFGGDVVHEAPTLRGGRPSGDPSELRVKDGSAAWADRLRLWYEEDLDLLAESRFADLEPALRDEAARRLAALDGEFDPILGRVDHGWFNLLVNRETGHLETVLDWGVRFAVPRGFDLAVVEYLLAGGWWLPLPDVPDRRPLVREALLEAYSEVATVPDDLATQRRCYFLTDVIRGLGLLEKRAGETPRAIPADRIEEAASSYRDWAASELERQ